MKNLVYESSENFYTVTRLKGHVVNVPFVLVSELLNKENSSAAISYLKLRFICQNSYGSFRLIRDNKRIRACMGLSERSFKNHVRKLFELGWLRNTHEDFYQIVSFNKSHADIKILKLTTEQIFSVTNSKKEDLTRLVFDTRMIGEERFTVGLVKDNQSITLQEFRSFLSEMIIEIDSTKKKNYIKLFDKSNGSKNLTSPTSWQRDCQDDSRHIALRYTAKTVNLSASTIKKYRTKAHDLKLSAYNRNLSICKDEQIKGIVYNEGINALNDLAIKALKENRVAASKYGRFFHSRNGALILNACSTRTSYLSGMKMVGYVRGCSKSKALILNQTKVEQEVEKVEKVEEKVEKVEVEKVEMVKSEVNIERFEYFMESHYADSFLISYFKELQPMVAGDYVLYMNPEVKTFEEKDIKPFINHSAESKRSLLKWFSEENYTYLRKVLLAEWYEKVRLLGIDSYYNKSDNKELIQSKMESLNLSFYTYEKIEVLHLDY